MSLIYAVLPYYPREGTLDRFFACLRAQSEDYRLIAVTSGGGISLPETEILNAGRRIYWTEAMNIAYGHLLTYGADDDVVCLLIDDLVFEKGFFSEGKRVNFGEVLLPYVYDEKKRLIDGGIQVDWRTKAFSISTRIDCFSPRGVFLKLRDFRRSGGFNKWLPHYLSDYEWSMRLVNSGIQPKRMKMAIETIDEGRNAPVFSRLNSPNPIYWTIFLFLRGRNKYLPLNLLKVWVHAARQLFTA